MIKYIIIFLGIIICLVEVIKFKIVTKRETIAMSASNNIIEYIDENIEAAGEADEKEVREKCYQNIIDVLLKNPNISNQFVVNSVINHKDEWHLNVGLKIIQRMNVLLDYDIGLIVDFIKKSKAHICYKISALRCLTVIAEKINENILYQLLDELHPELKFQLLDKITIALTEISDREKAYRILKKCLFHTSIDITKYDVNSVGGIVSAFIYSINNNEDLYERCINDKLEPHESVLISVSFLNEKWPENNKYRKIAEESAKKSKLAKLYLENYLKDID